MDAGFSSLTVITKVKGRNITFLNSERNSPPEWRCICRTVSGPYSVLTVEEFTEVEFEVLWESSAEPLPELILNGEWKQICQESAGINLRNLMFYNWNSCKCSGPLRKIIPYYTWFSSHEYGENQQRRRDPVFGCDVLIFNRSLDKYKIWTEKMKHVLTDHVRGGFPSLQISAVFDPWVWFRYCLYPRMVDPGMIFAFGCISYPMYARSSLELLWKKDEKAFRGAVAESSLHKTFDRKYLTSGLRSVTSLTADQVEAIVSRFADMGMVS